ncbi:hypothetical protein PENSPDRAFT_650492 [Peniophora sp. CONT]|nr:hypothetical protein PENSPDRAFT_650492 [Peniophora sp. CONT]
MPSPTELPTPSGTDGHSEGLTELAILSVARGAVVTSIAGACITASYALLRGRGTRVARMYAIDASVNCAIAGATFFSVKNYWVEPILAKSKASETSQQPVTDASELPSWRGLRTRGLPDVALSGAVTGGLFGWRRYSLARGTLPGALAGAAFCSLVQLSANEVGVQRLRYISRERLRASLPSSEPAPPPPTPNKPFLMRFMGWLGVKQMTKEEYLKKLRAERDLVWEEILLLEEEERRREQEEGGELPPTEDSGRMV